VRQPRRDLVAPARLAGRLARASPVATAGAGCPSSACGAGADRRAEELATRSPLGARRRRGRTQQTCRRDRVRPGEGPGTRPFAHLACAPGREARGSQGPSRRAATYHPSVQTVPKRGRRGKYRNEQFTQALQVRRRAESGAVTRRTAGGAPRTTAAHGGSRPSGMRASRRRRSRTRSGRSARAGSRPGAARLRS
jgi:hypothetical protein